MPKPWINFYPRPPGGGRPFALSLLTKRRDNFYPRPPGGGRRPARQGGARANEDFYPRPPGGGRPRAVTLSCSPPIYFYPRPPGGGRRLFCFVRSLVRIISIHALRVEGDRALALYDTRVPPFLSTPSGWRATSCAGVGCVSKSLISIHALRVEGDQKGCCHLQQWSISIHALRVEGDTGTKDFRPVRFISIHALRVEGDPVPGATCPEEIHFYPRPPGGGRRATNT